MAEYLQRVHDVGLGEFAAPLAAAARPSIRLRAAVVGDMSQICSSRLGGMPDLPDGATWPSNDDSPLSFIAQINLHDVHPHDVDNALPPDGLLSFFYEAVDQRAWGFRPADHGAFAVLYTPPTTPLVRLEAPSDLDRSGIFRPVALAAEHELTFVPWESFTAEKLGMSQAQTFEYADVFEDDDEDSRVIHRLLGHPDMVQGDMQVECQLVTNGLYCGDSSGYEDPRAPDLRRRAGEWRLLFQVDSEDAAQMMWGDVGRLYYWIKDADLADRNWQLSWLILQCG